MTQAFRPGLNCVAPTALGEDDKLQMVDLKLKVAKMPILRRVPFALHEPIDG